MASVGRISVNLRWLNLGAPSPGRGGVLRPGTGSDLNTEFTTDLWQACRSLSPYTSLVLDLSPSCAVWALRLRYTLAIDASHNERWVTDVGPARLHLDRLIEPAARLNGAWPLLILEGCLVRRWGAIPVVVELSPWSGRQSELAVRSWRWPNQPRWYFPATVAALRILRSEIIAWSYHA
jgi:hypothetical protein